MHARLFSGNNRESNKRVHERLGVNYYNFIMKLRLPLGNNKRGGLYQNAILSKRTIDTIKNDFEKLKVYYQVLKTNKILPISHPTMTRFKNRLVEISKYIKKHETIKKQHLTSKRVSTPRKPVVQKRKPLSRKVSKKPETRPRWR